MAFGANDQGCAGFRRFVVIGRRFYRTSAHLDLVFLQEQEHIDSPQYMLLSIAPNILEDVSRVRRNYKLGDMIELSAEEDDENRIQHSSHSSVFFNEICDFDSCLQVVRPRAWSIPQVSAAREQRAMHVVAAQKFHIVDTSGMEACCQDTVRAESSKEEMKPDVGGKKSREKHHEQSLATACHVDGQHIRGRKVQCPEAGGGAFAEDAYALAQWLLSKGCPLGLSKEDLNSGSGVLDIAGGAGDFSALLNALGNGIRCTVIDPRPSAGSLCRTSRKRMRKVGLELPEAIKASFTFPASAGDSSCKATESAAASTSDCCTIPMSESVRLQQVAHCCSLLVGLHPDQATDAIVDFAVATRTPFVVVPCCVFGRDFPHRRYRDHDTGLWRKVETPDDLRKYLAAKHPGICLAKLDFPGADVALYCNFREDASGQL